MIVGTVAHSDVGANMQACYFLPMEPDEQSQHRLVFEPVRTSQTGMNDCFAPKWMAHNFVDTTHRPGLLWCRPKYQELDQREGACFDV
jgi:hypothetical protein